MLKEHSIEPSGDRKRPITWKTFIKSLWDVLAAIDFTAIEVWTKRGLVTCYLLFVMGLSTRRALLAWMLILANRFPAMCEDRR